MGVKRQLDELGRVCIPKQFRKEIHMKSGEKVDVFLEDNKVIIKKLQTTPEKQSMFLIQELRELNKDKDIDGILNKLKEEING